MQFLNELVIFPFAFLSDSCNLYQEIVDLNWENTLGNQCFVGYFKWATLIYELIFWLTHLLFSPFLN